MPTTIDSAGITFNDASTITSANTFIAKPASPSNGQVLSYDGSTWISQNPSIAPTSAKAWVNFNGTTSPGTIRSSYNVSSVTKNGTGDYTVNFATAMTDANYSVNGITSIAGQSTSLAAVGIFSVKLSASNTYSNKTISQVQIVSCGNSTNTILDGFDVNVAIFGN
jgi:hypothetical protein